MLSADGREKAQEEPPSLDGKDGYILAQESVP